MIVIITGIVIGGFLLTTLIGTSLEDFSSKAKDYNARIQQLTLTTFNFLENKGFDIPEKKLAQYIDPAAAVGLASRIFNGLGKAFGNAFLILFTVIFMLYEAAEFPNKLRLVLKNPESSIPRFEKIMHNVNHYLAIKTLTSLSTGLLVAIWLAILGVDFPILWGILAFLLNFVPNIGSILAAVPAVLIALVQLGIDSAIWTAIAFLVINNIIGTFVEPRFLGKGLGLSTLVVFASLVFWGWVLGPIGMFLSVPLTMALKIAVENNSKTQWIAVLMGPTVKIPQLEEDHS